MGAGAVAAVVVPVGHGVVTGKAIVDDEGTADVVGRLGVDLEVESLVVEEDPGGGAKLGGV